MQSKEKYYNEIKDTLINIKVSKKASEYYDNYKELTGYYNVGKMIVEAQGGEKHAKYGESLIKEYSRKLTTELGKGYSEKNLKRMRQYYLFQKGSAVPTELSWSHVLELLALENRAEINYYISIVKSEKLSYRQLHDRIKSKEYDKLDVKTKNKFINNNFNDEKVTEKMLKELILRNMENFLEQLGEGFSFIKSEYKIKYESEYNYIDLLLFNYIYNCFVVVELKATKLVHSHIGQITHYINYVDSEIKNISQNKTIGIIICKSDNRFVVRYCSDERIFRTTYILT